MCGVVLVNHCRILDAGDDFDGTPALTAGFDVDVEHPFEALCPSHGCMAFGRCLLRTGCLRLVAPAPPGRRHLGAVGAVGGKHAVVAGEIDSRPRHQGGQAGDEVQRLEDNVGGAVAIRCLQLVADVAVGCE